MILVDYAGHLTSTESEEELHEFAAKLNIKRSLFQNSSVTLKHPHYNLNTKQINAAFYLEATEVSPQELVRLSWWR